MVFIGGQYPMLPSCAVNIFLRHTDVLMDPLHHVWFQERKDQVDICAKISYFVFSNVQTNF